MGQATLVAAIDPARAAGDDAARTLIEEVAARLSPGLEASTGAVDSRHGDRSGTTWSAEGWQPDGTLVILTVEVGKAAVTLHVDTSPIFKAPVERMTWFQRVSLAGLTVGPGGAVWWRYRSFGWTLAAIAAGVIVFTAVEILWTMRKERLARARPVDESHWRNRLDDALAGRQPG